MKPLKHETRERMTHSTYEFWEHGQSGAVFAVRLSADRRVTGCTGPLFSNQIRTVELPRYAYDDDPRELSWIERHRESWAPAGFIGAPYQ